MAEQFIGSNSGGNHGRNQPKFSGVHTGGTDSPDIPRTERSLRLLTRLGYTITYNEAGKMHIVAHHEEDDVVFEKTCADCHQM